VKKMKGVGFAFFLVAFIGSGLPAQDPARRIRTEPWPEAVLDRVARIPVQEGGRIKPLGTFAGFQLLAINGKRRHTTAWGETLTPVAWLLDCWFFPEQARHYRVIAIDDARAVSSFGLRLKERKRRDRYSLHELGPILPELGRQGRIFAHRDARSRSALESQIVNLAGRASRLDYLLGFLDFARERIPVAGVSELEELFPGRSQVRFLELVERFPALRAGPGRSHHGALAELFDRLGRILDSAGLVAMLPPEDANNEVYESPGLVLNAVLGGRRATARLVDLDRFQDLVDARRDLDRLAAGLESLQGRLAARATERGEYGKIGLEVDFYRADWLSRALYGFLFGFLGCAALWIKRKKWIYRGSCGLVLLGEALLITGIVIRCVIRERPPVTTPYEAILFLVAVGVGLLLFTEYTRRSGLPIAVAAVTGALGLMVAAWHERVEGVDTMQPLVAVLDTNFWLATHVTTVVLGYCGGLVAALVAHLYLFGKLLGFRRGDARFYGDLARILYGILCFGLLFSTVGTILGGVWANDSWGRFWGWDPKENGALMLVLAYLVVVHARLGGYLREHGIAVASVLIGIIVMWAFWGVNLYQVGLHSYGFTETKKHATVLYYAVEGAVAALGCIAGWWPRRRRWIGVKTADPDPA